VTSAMFDTRLRKSEVESNASFPVRSRRRIHQKKRTRMAIPTMDQRDHQWNAVVGGEDAEYQHDQPQRGEHGTDRVERPVGLWRDRVGQASAEQQDDHDDEGLEQECGTPADGGGDQAADERTGRCAQAAESADDPERPRARSDVRQVDGG